MLDMLLPDQHGLDLLVTLRALPALRDCQFVVASASGAEADRLRAQQAGADGFWPKPLDFGLLTDEFTRRLGRPVELA
jgi:CheY-like chemotaxis protein